MFRTLKLWWIQYQIKNMERREKEGMESLNHLRFKLLPSLREKRNRLLFGR